MNITEHLLGGRYRLEERLAIGGMGDVWRAHDEHMGRPVAVKLIRDDLASDPAAVERLRREARTAASLAHPNVATVLDIVNGPGDGDPPAIVMELVEGETLAERLDRQGALDPAEAVAVADGLLAALEAAHAAGVVHRDVKPANVLISHDGTVKVTDFGVARSSDEGARLTDTGMVVGTAHYLAPEQLRDEPTTAATDQYATGLVLYEALTGHRAFEAETPAAAALARLHVDPPPVRQRRADIPEPLGFVVSRALGREPRDRFASVAHMRAALHAAATEAMADGVTEPRPAVMADTPTATMPVGVTTTMPTGPSESPPTPPAAGGLSSRLERKSLRRWALALVAALVLLVAGFRVSGGQEGPSTIQVPDVTGVHVDAATATLEEMGLRLEPVTVDAAEPAGTVLAQNVAAGVWVADGSAVGAEVSSGTPPCCTVPPLVGMAVADAQNAVVQAGLTVVEVKGQKSDLPEGTVMAQEPPPGEPASPGDPVALEVSTGDDDDEKGRGNGPGRSDD